MWSHLIDRVTEDIGHWDVYSIIKLKSWSQGHVAVIGDAAHAQPPNLGQGAGMAMQNALALAYFLNQIDSPDQMPSALARWETSERPIIEHCQKWSVLYGEVIYLPEALRRRTFHAAFDDPWISGQFFKPANHVPTGSFGLFGALGGLCFAALAAPPGIGKNLRIWIWVSHISKPEYPKRNYNFLGYPSSGTRHIIKSSIRPGVAVAIQAQNIPVQPK